MRTVGPPGSRVTGHSPSADVLCLHCMLAGLEQKPWARKRVSPHILAIAPEGVFVSKGTCRKRVTQYLIHYSVGLSVESTFHVIMKLFPRTKINGYLTHRFIPH